LRHIRREGGMQFSGKKKRKGFGSFAGGSTRGTPESHVPDGMKSSVPTTPGVPGIVPGLPGTGSQPTIPKPQKEPLYGRKVRKGKNYTPLIIFGGVGVLVLVCVIIALTMSREILEPEKAIMDYIAATEARDAGAIYDLLSGLKRLPFESQLRQLKELPADSQGEVCARLGIPPEKVNSLKPRDFFILMCKKGESLPEAKEIYEKFSGFRTTACTMDGNMAWVTIRHDKAKGSCTVGLMKEDGRWKISKFPGE
jgi:hypothetical protein